MLLIAVLRSIPSGLDNPVGAATPVSQEILLTCAHVLREGKYPRQAGARVRLRIADQSETVYAEIVEFPWIDPGAQWPPDERLPVCLDIVALRLLKPISDVPPARSLDHSDAQKEMTTFGFPVDAPSGREARVRMASMKDARGLRQLNWIPGQVPVDLGFSGGAVWDGAGHAVGMIVSRWRPEDSDHHSAPLGFMLPLTAVSYLFSRHRISGFSIEPAVLAKYKGARNLLVWAQERLDENPYHKKRATQLVPVTFAVGQKNLTHAEVFSNIERLHSGDDDALTAFEQLRPADVCNKGHYYVQAPGGAGKSFALYELVIASVSFGFLPVLIDAIEGGAAIKKALTRETVEQQLQGLFEACKSKVAFKYFQQAESNEDPILLVLDGLNEASADVNEIITLAVNTTYNYSNVHVVIVDRLTKRQGYHEPFSLATVAPLAPESVQAIIPGFADADADFQRLLRIPFFFDLFQESEDARPGKRTRILQEYIGWLLKPHQELEAHVEAARRKLAEIAFEAYHKGGQNLSQDMFLAAGLDAQRLADAGLLRKNTPSTYVFRHQLMHDHLASRHFLDMKMHADTDNLNTLTLNRRSWDCLVLALEDSDSQKADQLLIDIYNWDHSATLSCVAVTRNDPNDALAIAICAVLSEKLEDTFLHTRLRTAEKAWALRRFLRTDGELSVANTLEQIRNDEKRFVDSPLHQWWLAFTAGTVTRELWRALVGIDPLAGWSAAAALRRILAQGDMKDERVLERLLILYDALRNQARAKEPGPIRWRVVHVLGRFTAAVDQLIEIGFDADENDDVRYGAFRELIEIAARSSTEQGPKILSTIANKLNVTSVPPRPLSAFRSCAILKRGSSEEPTWWRAAYKRLLAKAMEQAQRHADNYAAWEDQKVRFEADERQTSI